MTDLRRRIAALSGALAIALGVLAGCGTEPQLAASSTPTPSAVTVSPTPDTASPTPQESAVDKIPVEENPMRIAITIGSDRFTATLDDSAAGRDLLTQLPVTVEMSDHAAVEKTGRLPVPLSLDGQPSGADPAVGALGYYAPGQDLVLYYGDQSYYEGIVVLGRLDDDAADRIAQLDGGVTATITAVDS